MGFWASKNVSPIGVDFGTDSIKLLQIVPDDPPQLVAAAAATIPEEARHNPDTYRQWLGGALRDLLREGKFRGRRAVASLSAAHTYVQHVRLAKSEGIDLDEQIETELRGRLPLDPTGLVIRHVNAGEVIVEGGARQEIICLAASRDAVLRQVNTVRAAGLDIRGMHCEPMAILASFAHLFRRGGDHERTTLFLDLGHSCTKAMIAHGKDLKFAKTIHVAGDHFTRELAGQLGIDPAEARIRREQESNAAIEADAPRAPQSASDVGIGSTRDGRRPGKPVPGLGETIAGQPAAETNDTAPAPTATQTQTETQTDELLETLTDELRLCLGYHGAMFADRPVEKIVFLGGESRQTALCQKIAKRMSLAAQLGDPLARLIRAPGATPPVGVDLRQAQPGWAVPMGLCMLPTNL